MAREGIHPEDQAGWAGNNDYRISVDDTMELQVVANTVIVPHNLTVGGTFVSGTNFTMPSGSIDRISCQVLSASQGLQVTGSIEAVGTISATSTISATGDINAAGGFAQSFEFVQNNLLQGQYCNMTASLVGTVAYLGVPMVRAGSVRGIAIKPLNTTQTIKSGAFSASVMLNSANVACAVNAYTGSLLSTTIAKDVVAFTAGQMLGVSLSASADYLSEPGVTSASFIASVLVEM